MQAAPSEPTQQTAQANVNAAALQPRQLSGQPQLSEMTANPEAKVEQPARQQPPRTGTPRTSFTMRTPTAAPSSGALAVQQRHGSTATTKLVAAAGAAILLLMVIHAMPHARAANPAPVLGPSSPAQATASATASTPAAAKAAVSGGGGSSATASSPRQAVTADGTSYGMSGMPSAASSASIARGRDDLKNAATGMTGSNVDPRTVDPNVDSNAYVAPLPNGNTMM